MTIGEVLAGLLIGIGAALATGTTAALYALALVGLAFVPREPFSRVPHHLDQTRRLRSEPIAGMREIWSVVIVRKLTIFTAMMNVTWGIWAAIFVIYATDPDLLDLSPRAYGMLLAVMSIGGFVIAGAVSEVWNVRAAMGLTTVFGLVTTVVVVWSIRGIDLNRAYAGDDGS